MIDVQFVTNFDEVIEELESRDAIGKAKAAAMFSGYAVDLEHESVDIMRFWTPKGETERLSDSTHVENKEEFESPDHERLRFSLVQDAASEPNWDGTGGGYHYGLTVRDGRPGITAPSDGPYSTGKKALRTPWGPRKSVGPAQAQPYNLWAEPDIKTATELMASRWTQDVIRSLAGE